MQKILTVPSVIERGEPYYLTGNHYVSLPDISTCGVIRNIAFLSGELRALMEFHGAISPFVRANGRSLSVNEAAYTHDFIPTFYGEGEGISYTLSYAAPENIHGFVCRFICRAQREVSLSAGLEIDLERVSRTVFHSYDMDGHIHAFHYTWTNTLVCELISGKSYGGFGVCGDDAVVTARGAGGTVRTDFVLHAGEERTLTFYVSAAAETDGIGLVAMDMRRRGSALVSEHEALLDKRHIALPNAVLERYANFNMNFCFYYSVGYTLDTEELSLVTSKSTAYYVSAAFWSRDSFLWAFPSVLRVSPELAREALLCGFTKYIRHVGIHALYTDGTVLYPGFELDEQVAPVIALKRYVEKTGDCAILELPCIKDGFERIKRELSSRYNADIGLFSTELDPSDDPVQYPFLTYDNGLCVAALEFMGETEFAQRVKRAITEICVTEFGGKRIFAYLTDGENCTVYDDPPGSLALLAHYGVVDRSDKLFQNTLEYIYSNANAYFYSDGIRMGAGCEHTPYPWAASLVNLLLARGCADEKAIAALAYTASACPVACESFSLADGGLCTGDAFATMAGFLSEGIFISFGK